MILMVWACMYVFYIAALTTAGLIATGYLVSFLVRRRRARVEAAAEGRVRARLRPAYTGSA